MRRSATPHMCGVATSRMRLVGRRRMRRRGEGTCALPGRRACASPHNRPLSPRAAGTARARGGRSRACAPRPDRPPGAACAGARTSTRAGSRRSRRPPPCTWIARSITFRAMFGAATLIAAISVRAWRLPTVSISHAAFSVSSRAISISMRDSAIQSCTFPRVATGWPNVTRETALRHIASSARSAAPIERMQWWMRPGPSRAWAIMKPSPSPAIRFSAGTRTSSNRTSAWPSWS